MASWIPTERERSDLRAYAKECAAGLEVQLDIGDHNIIAIRAQRGGENVVTFNRITVAATSLVSAKRLVKAGLDDILENLRVPGAVHTIKR
jgi:hypothetical protein